MNNSIEFKAKVQHTQEFVQHTFRGSYSHLCAQKSRQRATFNSIYTVQILSICITYFWHRFQGGTDRHVQVVPYGFRTGPYSLFLAQKLRHISVWFFWEVWHGFQGGHTTINAPKYLLKLLVQILRWPYNSLEAQKSRSRPIDDCIKLWKEFCGVGSFSCVKNWHGCRDKFVI
jgi:hypothetical protein